MSDVVVKMNDTRTPSASWGNPVSYLLLLPCGLLPDAVLVHLTVGPLGLTLMACINLRESASEVIIRKMATPLHLQRREGESVGSLLFAVRVLRYGRPSDTHSPTDVWTCGCNSLGTLGHKIRQPLNPMPERVEAMFWKRVVQIAAGKSHTVFLLSNGHVFTCGHGEHGRLGHGDEGSHFVPHIVRALVDKRVVYVAAGALYTAFVTSEGELFTCGKGENGRLGHGGLQDEYVPRRVDALIGKCVVRVSIHVLHSVAITSDGKVFTFGFGEDGRLGHGIVSLRSTPGSSELVPRKIDSLDRKFVIQAEVGDGFTAVLTSEGAVFTFGSGVNGCLGNGNNNKECHPTRVDKLTKKRVVHIAAGGSHVAAITSEGEMFTWGCGVRGQLGHGNYKTQQQPCRVDALVGHHVTHAAAGYQHTIALTSDGKVFTWGMGEYGQLGHDSSRQELEPSLIQFLQGERIVQVTAGWRHSGMIGN